MNVDTISEAQTQFKGLFILKNAMKGSERIAKKAVPAELVSFEPLYAKVGNQISNNPIGTELCYAGEKFKLNLPFENVLAAYEKVAFTNKSIELNENNYIDNNTSPFFPD